MKYLVMAFIAAGVGLLIWKQVKPGPGEQAVKLVEPVLSEMAVAGKQKFEENCASCHGKSASGTKIGPPLVHDIYNPGHHPDEAFYAAAKRGVRQHHWPFGDMPAQPKVSEKDMALIVKYMRELQLANGITYREHKM